MIVKNNKKKSFLYFLNKFQSDVSQEYIQTMYHIAIIIILILCTIVLRTHILYILKSLVTSTVRPKYLLYQLIPK